MGLWRWLLGSATERAIEPLAEHVGVTAESQLGLPFKITISEPIIERDSPPARRIKRWPAPDAPEKGSGIPCLPLGPAKSFGFDIVGEASYLNTLRSIADGRLSEEAQEQAAQEILEADESGDKVAADTKVYVRCIVIPEPSNPHDSNAVRVEVAGCGTVGYFCREDAVRYRGLAKRLIEMGQVGTCEGVLTGGWEDDVNIGVRLSILGPNAFDPSAPPDDIAPVILANGWESWKRVPVGPGRGFKFNISRERDCATVISRIDGGRVASHEPVIFETVLVPQRGRGEFKPAQIIVHAEGHGVVGAFTAGTVEKYQALFDHLIARPAVGACQGMLFPESAEALGVRLSIKGPKEVMKGLK